MSHMRIYRDPIYLNREALTPIANSFGIEVDTSIEVATRDLTNKKGGFDAGATIPGTSIGIKGNLGGGTESEISQKRTVTAHPGAALNNLIEKLQEDASLIDLSDGQAITKSALIEIESDWELSPVTDQGRILNLFIEQILQNPNNIPKKVPDKLIQDALKSRPTDPIAHKEKPRPAVCEAWFLFCTPYGIRTRVTGVRGRRPRPLDERGLELAILLLLAYQDSNLE